MTRRPFRPLFWSLSQLGSRVRFTPSVAGGLATIALPAETGLVIPTRHGPVRAVVVRPASGPADSDPPVVLQLHGGGFLNRYPEQDRHIARYLASRLGAVVVLPDYSTAPGAQYPDAEEEMDDVARWVGASGRTHGWDGSRLLLSGISAGSKLAINICQQIHTSGGVRPLAVLLIVPVTDMSRTDRTSPARRPVISPFVQRLVAWAYVPDVTRRREALASPRYDPSVPLAMPPTLIQTAEYDTLATEGRELALSLRAAGVPVVHKTYAEADHGFYSQKPVARVDEMLGEIVDFFAERLTHSRVAGPPPA
ncbi:Acetyl esterase/lipase [Rathayibacter oskolensis]|uniref:Acetyl esterase/lipase n=1 Tax=Rathayibacter oskolensis TaxID=1891671 RepID=A0A1X7N435_9MICO|nr:Acetyl esterase/lipase [Rathayibacter oskolensis]